MDNNERKTTFLKAAEGGQINVKGTTRGYGFDVAADATTGGMINIEGDFRATVSKLSEEQFEKMKIELEEFIESHLEAMKNEKNKINWSEKMVDFVIQFSAAVASKPF
ncbi:hypothetical protein [Salinithrix halophila]|uniref:Uncharacterized protein n=1 Tax=Salinithrix halophila TaxID=1485204 RepID=A0ABV8JDE3_9BACL